MKGRIDTAGNLYIERAGILKQQQCPFTAPEHTEENALYMICGDHCPHFSEPFGRAGSSAMLTICQKRMLGFEEFEDLRGQGVKG